MAGIADVELPLRSAGASFPDAGSYGDAVDSGSERVRQAGLCHTHGHQKMTSQQCSQHKSRQTSKILSDVRCDSCSVLASTFCAELLQKLCAVMYHVRGGNRDL